MDKDKIWTTKAGDKIRVCDMVDSHIRNTIAKLKGQWERITNLNDASCGAPDFTTPCFADTTDIEEWIAVFEEELRYRGYRDRIMEEMRGSNVQFRIDLEKEEEASEVPVVILDEDLKQFYSETD